MRVVVAGHLCLDLIPAFRDGAAELEPGRLLEVGPATLAGGGGVANVGQALLRLGVEATLMGKVGDDAFGALLEGALAPGAAHGLLRAPGESTAYTIVLSPPGTDRIFLHHPGCNDTFDPTEIEIDAVAGADVFYFGYPPLLRRTYRDGGRALAELLERVRGLGLTTVLDLALPDPASEAAACDWRAFLARVLPHTDFLMPSLQEVCFMLGVPLPAAMASLGPVADALLGMGAGVVALKLGAGGLYLKSGRVAQGGLGRAVSRSGAGRLEAGGATSGAGRRRSVAPPDGVGPAAEAPAWSERELWTPVFEAAVKGTTGAGDATIAGFIAALLQGRSPEACLTLAVAVGAASVEALDAVSGVGTLAEVTARLQRGWRRAPVAFDVDYWRPVGEGVFGGRADRPNAAR